MANENYCRELCVKLCKCCVMHSLSGIQVGAYGVRLSYSSVEALKVLEHIVNYGVQPIGHASKFSPGSFYVRIISFRASHHEVTVVFYSRRTFYLSSQKKCYHK